MRISVEVPRAPSYFSYLVYAVNERHTVDLELISSGAISVLSRVGEHLFFPEAERNASVLDTDI